MIEVVAIIVILIIFDQKRLCPKRYITLSHVSLSKKRDMVDTWARNTQEIVTTKFNNCTIYYNIHANNIYTDKVDYITICTEHISSDFFEIKPRNLLDNILIKLNIYNELEMQNSLLRNLVLVLSKNKKSSRHLFSERLQEELAYFFNRHLAKLKIC